MEHDEDVSRPITLYVDQFIFDDIDMSHLNHKRVTVVDIEMSLVDARELSSYMRYRLDDQVPGSIRIRIRGCLMLG